MATEHNEVTTAGLAEMAAKHGEVTTTGLTGWIDARFPWTLTLKKNVTE